MSTKEILELLKEPVICVIAGERKEFLSGQEAKAEIKDNYDITEIKAEGDQVVLLLQKSTSFPDDLNNDWVKEHAARYGAEPNLFDGM